MEVSQGPSALLVAKHRNKDGKEMPKHNEALKFVWLGGMRRRKAAGEDGMDIGI